jgi:hypothetical protein
LGSRLRHLLINLRYVFVVLAYHYRTKRN